MPKLNLNQISTSQEDTYDSPNKVKIKKKQQRDIYKKKNSKQDKEDDYRD